MGLSGVHRRIRHLPGPGRTAPASIAGLVLALGLIVASAAGGSVLRKTVTFSPAEFSLDRSGGVTRIRLAGCPDWNQPGAPLVPFRTVHLIVPEGETVRAVRVTPREVVDLGVIQAPAEGISRPGAPRAAWDGRSAWPPEAGRAGEMQWMRGTAIQGIVLWPVQWDPATGHAVLRTELDLEVETAPAPPPAGTFRSLRRNSRADREFAAIACRLALNPEAAGAAARREELKPLDSGATPFSPRFRPSVDGSPVEFVIITSEELAPFFEPLASWKTERGIPTVVRSLEWIRANYPNGVDRGETIRRFISDAAARWGTESILLAGDSDLIPVRYGSTLYYGGEMIPADMYYQCLDGNWNADGDATFGEAYVNSSITGDSADLLPEVWLGRAPVSDSTAAAVFVNKVLTYEKTPPAGYAGRAMIMAEVLFPQNYTPGDSIIYDGAVIAEQGLSRFPGTLSVTRLYENYPDYEAQGALPEDLTSVVVHVNQGYGLVQHIGHGYINTMTVGLGGGALDNNEVLSFMNGSRLAILYSINCTSAAIDYNCIGEAWLKNDQGGAVANIGSTRYDFPGTGVAYQNEYYRLLFEEKVPSLGQAFGGSKIPFVSLAGYDSEDRWTQFSQILLGDPTLRVWTAEPSALSASHPGSLTLGSESVAVTVTSGGAPVDSATVCLDKPGDDYAVGVTDASGQVTLTFRPDHPGQATLTVTGRNGIPYQAVLPVATPSAPHLFAASTAVDDSTPPASGNADGVFDLGETVNLNLVLANQGTGPATGITGVLTSGDPNLVVVDGSAAWPDLGPGGSAPPSNGFAVLATGTAIDRYETTATLQITAAGYSRSEPVRVLVGVPLLERYHISVSDTTLGDGDGTIEYNEDQVLKVVIRNNGLGTVRGLSGRLRATDAYTLVSDSVSTYGDIAPGEKIPADGFVFRFLNYSLYHNLTFILEAGGQPVMNVAINVVKPGTPVLPSAGGRASSIALRWTAVTDGDLRGYAVYRANASGGPYRRINAFADSKIAYYNDEDLPPLTRYYYKVSAIDQSGNQSAASAVFSATTTLPLHERFPILLGGATSSSPTFSYFNGDTIPEIVCGSEEIYVLSGTGEEYLDGDNDARTYGVFSNSGYANFWSPPSSTDIDRDGVIDVCSAGFLNGLLYLFDGRSAPKPGFPVSINVAGSSSLCTWSAPCMADVDGDSTMEIFINSGGHTYAYRADGQELVDGDGDPKTTGVFAALGIAYNYATPVVADLNGDKVPEVVIGSQSGKLWVKKLDGSDYTGFPMTFGGSITSTPAIGDLNGDGLPEMVFGSSDNKLNAVNINKAQAPGWPKGVNFNQDLDSSPALADVDGDTYLDVAICAGNGTVYIFHGESGAIFTGYPVSILDSSGARVPSRSSPVIGNVDSDPGLDVVVGAQDGNLYAFRANGTAILGFPIKTDNVIEGAALLWDLDGDGLTEVCLQGFDQKLYEWDTPAPFTPESCPWPMFAHDSRRSGIYGEPIFIVTGVPETAVPPSAAWLAQNVPNPFNPVTRIRYEVPPGEGRFPVTLEIFDAAGRRVKRLVDADLPAGEHFASWDGAGDDGIPAGSGVYFYRLTVNGRATARKMVLAR